jgi:C-3',4' desaturase CrtD
MNYEIVVVGGGIGGLTTAALLAARGLDVCLFERQSRPGGCVAPFEKFGYTFESGAGLYALWQPGEIHDRIFRELPVGPPEVRQLEPAYVVRLPDGSEISVGPNTEEFFDLLRTNFPECADKATAFYRDAELIGEALLDACDRVPDLRTANRFRQLRALAMNLKVSARLRSVLTDTVLEHLQGTSLRFRRFIDAQLQILAQCDAEQCTYLFACAVLSLRRHGLFAIRGGGGELARLLTESIKQSGGIVRLDTSVLRLAYDSSETPVGVDLLSGETVTASRAIVSNMTVWDTYGKLVGMDHTPAEIRKRLKELRGWGSYLLFLGVDEHVAESLPADHIVAVSDLGEEEDYDPAESQLTFALAPWWDARGPKGKRAATVQAFTDVEQWFAFHEDEEEHEKKDQAELESVWQRLHGSIPELSDSLEVIETMTPLDHYAATRRKLGMVGGLGQSLAVSGPNSFSHRTPFTNLFLVGDTTFPGSGVAAVSQSALIVANEICGKS